jgi:hypothetical protein
MTAPILIIAGLLAAAALAIWQVRRPPWESKRYRRKVELSAQQIPDATIDPATRARPLPPKAPERWRELAEAEVGYTIGAVGGAVSGQAMIPVRAVPGDESTQPPVGVWVLCYDGPPWLAAKRDEYEEWSEWWRPQPPAPPTESEPGARKRALGRTAEWATDGVLGGMMATAQGGWVVAASKLLEGFERGVFVRSTEYDAEGDWAIRAFPYIQALGALKCLVDEAEQAARGDR